MVNITPIPPLLCSTPPPIDFGEDDEDIDVLPHSLGGMEDNFSDFLAEVDIKSNESIPSPRPPSVCDLPKISIYDGLLLADEESSHIRTSLSPQPDDKINQDSKNNIKSNFAEAFNFDVKNSNCDTKNVLQNGIETETPHIKVNIKNLAEPEPNMCTSNSQDVYSEDISLPTISSFSKNIVKDLKMESLNAETKSQSIETNFSYTQNRVSIEDIEDDLSDDELYSPKVSKNFAETDNLSDYFKIEEIKTLNNVDIDPKCFDSFDNIPVELRYENDNDLNLGSSRNYIQNKFDMPTPLLDDGNSIDDDDFGDFADFRETHFSTNSVPVNDINIKPPTTDLEIKDFNDFTKYTTNEKFKDRLEDSQKLNTEISDSASDEPISKENSLDLQIISQEILTNQPTTITDNIDENMVMADDKKQSEEEFCHKGSNFDKNCEDFGEFSNPSQNCGDTKVKSHTHTSEYITNSTKHASNLSHDDDDGDDDFDGFADFESHQEVTKLNFKSSLSGESQMNFADNDDDDDFGDFNTAAPVDTTASSLTLSKTSPNTITETPTLPSINLNERISKILQLMFALTPNSEEKTSDEPKPNKIQDIPFTSIDAAKALEYQFLMSETRHSFIRSLGIDSKNILFGDKWNPSLPRFAANLSFNPLKPMKNVQSSGGTMVSDGVLVPTAVNNSEKTLTLEVSGNTFDLDQKSLNATEQTIDAFKDNNFIPALTAATTSIPNISNELSITEAESLKIFENPLDGEAQFSKTPPISEMESVTTFSSPPPTPTIGKENPTTQIDLEEKLKNTVKINQVVTTSTFSGSFKETHIYTPPQTNDVESKHAIGTLSTTSSSPTKTSHIDFDYEKAAMGVIIDETVVKKEYRDVEYNPPFTMDTLMKSATCKVDVFDTNLYVNTNPNISSLTDMKVNAEDEDENNDDFSEFQSVSSDAVIPAAVAAPKGVKALEVPKSTAVSHGGMILSPAILIPQAIFLESQKPKIEWGDSTASINPEELARIEELFPEPRSLKSSNGSNTSQKSTPAHQVASTPSISATVAHKELEGNVNSMADDDDDWSDFVSVTVTNASAHKTGSNNILTKSPIGSPFQQISPITHKMVPGTHTKSSNDDEWSEFVSSAPPLQQPNAYRVPQFNSGAWQNANFYNKQQSAAAPTHPSRKYLYNNHNNCNISQKPYQIPSSMPPTMLTNSHQTPNNSYHQQVHGMQNFSTIPVPTPERLSATAPAAKSNQLQSISSSKIAPSIALIPDLSFVAPTIPTHTSFINSLPKPSINMKK